MIGPVELGQLTPEQREEYEERAAIKEFMGGMSRDEAEESAWLEVKGAT